jgi:type I restriction enzyme S subunit
MTMPEQKKAVVPRLRFPEFRDAGPWEVKRLGELGTIIKGKAISKSDIKPNGSLPCIRYGELYTHYREIIRTIVSFTEADPCDLVLSQQNDLIIPASGETKEDIATASCVMLDGVALGGDLNIFRSPIDGSFLAYYVRGNLKTQIAKVAQGDSVVHLYPSQLEKIELGVPHEPAEQQKIADCLSSLDELIELQAKQLEALQAHKKGLMQQLFPREGETTPRLRFPEFCDAGPWEVKRLGEVANVVRGGSPRPIDSYLTTSIDGLNWLKIGDLREDSKYVLSTEEKIKPSGLSKTREVFPGDLIMSNSMSFGRPYILKINCCIHDGWLAIKKLYSEIANEFLYYWILSTNSQKYFRGAAAGGGVRNLNADVVKLLPVTFPSLAEQQKIADCLSPLDELIELQAKQLEALQTHKKGLMQQLFPQEIDL